MGTRTAQEILGGPVQDNVKPRLADRSLAAANEPEPNTDSDLREERTLSPLATHLNRVEPQVAARFEDRFPEPEQDAGDDSGGEGSSSSSAASGGGGVEESSSSSAAG